MEGSVEVRVAAAAGEVFDVVADLGTWPRWLDVVTRATPDGEGAWHVTLGLRVGPLSLGYGVRMVRTVADRPGRLRFERDEGDGRPDHSPVVLDVAVSPVAGGASVRLDALVGKHVPLVDLGRELRRRGPRAVRRLEGLLRTPPV